MRGERLHRFERGGRRFAIDPDTCFCFECDEISWDVLEFYPQATVTKMHHELDERHDPHEIDEVVGELEWLRATRSILPVRKREELFKQFEVTAGLKQLTVELPAARGGAGSRRGLFGGAKQPARPQTNGGVVRDAVSLLLNRSAQRKDLRLTFVARGNLDGVDVIAELVADALRAARLAGKRLAVAVRVEGAEIGKRPEELGDHRVALALEFRKPADLKGRLESLAAASGQTLSRISKAIQPEDPNVTGRIIVTPRSPDFAKVTPWLDGEGFKVIELDLDGAYVERPDLDPRDMLGALQKTAEYYAKRLLKGKYFRLDPIAALFWRIYEGKGVYRSDPVGVNELAVDAEGFIYPAARWLGHEDQRVGCVPEGSIDEEALSVFEDVGALTTAACRSCWARTLCGGGTAAVHHALSGSARRPYEPWCDAQREWMAGAVSAFNILSSHGVNFTRVYSVLTGGRGGGKPGLLTMMKAAVSASLSMRPLEEADAEMLVRWENWNDAAYFTFTTHGVLLGNQYDREMQALHPSGNEVEMILTQRDGTPSGLLRIQPGALEGAAMAWLYLRKPAYYESGDFRKGLRFLFQQAGNAGSLSGAGALLIPAGPQEAGLRGLLESLGAARAGAQREALYLHGTYHDVDLYLLKLSAL